MKHIIIIIYWVIIILLFSFAGIAGYKTYTLGSDQNDYEILCLDDHQYWRANFMAKGFLAIKLNDEGKPVKCQLLTDR